MQLEHEEINWNSKLQNQKENQEENITISRGLRNFAPCEIVMPYFNLLFVFSSQITAVIVYCFCHFGNLHCIKWYIMPKQHFVRIKLFIIEVGGKLVEQAPFFFSFFLILFSFLTSQTPSEDDNSEDEWLNPLPP